MLQHILTGMISAAFTFLGITIRKLMQKKNNNNFEVAFFIDSPVLPINNVVEKK